MSDEHDGIGGGIFERAHPLHDEVAIALHHGPDAGGKLGQRDGGARHG